MSDKQQVSTWLGRDIRELTREELIEALEELGTMYHALLQSHQSSIETMRLISEARRRL